MISRIRTEFETALLFSCPSLAHYSSFYENVEFITFSSLIIVFTHVAAFELALNRSSLVDRNDMLSHRHAETAAAISMEDVLQKFPELSPSYVAPPVKQSRRLMFIKWPVLYSIWYCCLSLCEKWKIFYSCRYRYSRSSEVRIKTVKFLGIFYEFVLVGRRRLRQHCPRRSTAQRLRPRLQLFKRLVFPSLCLRPRRPAWSGWTRCRTWRQLAKKASERSVLDSMNLTMSRKIVHAWE